MKMNTKGVNKMVYLNAGINQSQTIVEKVGSVVNVAIDFRFKALKYDASGKVVLTSSGSDNPIGLGLSSNPETVKAGDELDIQIKDIGYWMVGNAVSKGALLSSDVNGKAVTASAGNYILAIALEGANEANEIIKVQICKTGYLPAE